MSIGSKRVLQWHLVASGNELEQQTLDGRYAIWRVAAAGLEGQPERWVAERSGVRISERSPSRLDAILACEEDAQRMPR